MYKTDVIRRVAHDTRLNQDFVRAVVNATLDQIAGTLKAGDTVVFPGFGTFYTAKRPAGTVRDIRSGQPVSYPARRVAQFRAGALLKQAVRKSK